VGQASFGSGRPLSGARRLARLSPAEGERGGRSGREAPGSPRRERGAGGRGLRGSLGPSRGHPCPALRGEEERRREERGRALAVPAPRHL